MRLSLKHKLYGIAIAIVVILFLIMYIPRAYRGSVTVLIKDKERINYEDDGAPRSKYLIYSDDEVFENVDDWFYCKFNSSDIYGQLNPGETYKIWMSGWRIHIFSSYRNIISIEKVIEPSKSPDDNWFGFCSGFGNPEQFGSRNSFLHCYS